MRRSTNLLAALIAAFSLTFTVGCLGELTTDDGIGDPDDPVDPVDPVDPDPTGAAAAFFDTNVKPLVSGCAAAGCHSGAGTDPLKFMGAGPEAGFYASITSYAVMHGNWNLQTAELKTKLQLAADNGVPHYGYQPWNADQLSVLEQWFSLERDERGATGDPVPDPGTNPGDTRALFAQWSGCMTLDNWEASQMARWADKGTSEGPCVSCHNNGEHLLHTNNDDTTMFMMNQYELFIIGFFAAQINPDATGEIVPAYDKLVRMGQGNNLGSLHPTYNTNVDNDQYFQYLTDFYQRTKALKDANQCGPAGYPMP
jgi:hypothetical protein